MLRAVLTFLLAGPAAAADLYAQIQLPSVPWAAGESQGMRVGILADGTVLLEDQKVAWAGSGLTVVEGKFEEMRTLSNARDVRIYADARSDSAQLGAVTQALFNAGFSHYSLMVTSTGGEGQVALPMVKLADANQRDADLVGRVLRPLVVHTLAGGLWMGREPEEGLFVADVDGAMDVATVRKLLAQDKKSVPNASWSTPWFDKGEPAGDAALVLSLLQQSGYRRILPSFGEGRVDSLPPPFPKTPGSIQVPQKAFLHPDGAVQVDSTMMKPAKIAGFQRDCKEGTCDVVVVHADGKRAWVARTADPVVPSDIPFLLARPVVEQDLSELDSRKPPETLGTWDVAPWGSFSQRFSLENYPRTEDVPGGGRPTTFKLGRLSQSQVQPVIQAHARPVSRCYEDALSRDPNLSGRMEVKIVVGEDGSVTSVVLKASTLRDEAVEKCVLEQLGKLSFDKPEGNGMVIVSLPLRFEQQ